MGEQCTEQQLVSQKRRRLQAWLTCGLRMGPAACIPDLWRDPHCAVSRMESSGVEWSLCHLADRIEFHHSIEAIRFHRIESLLQSAPQ